jgi:hypothetical protein
MVALSIEMNRLLGLALVDPRLQAQIFSEKRADALRDFGLSQHEHTLLMNSQARTLADLASDICAKTDSGTDKRPAWLTVNGEIDTRSLRSQALPDSISANAPAFQHLLNELTAQLANIEVKQEYQQGYHAA